MQAYLDDREDSRLPRQLAEQSRLPAVSNLGASGGRGSIRSKGTSMLVSGSDRTRSSNASQELPALTHEATSRSSTESIPSSLGHRHVRQFPLDVGAWGLLGIPPPDLPILQCPFNLLFCLLEFLSFDEWFAHSLTHFGKVGPPTSNQCCFCEAQFHASTGIRSWRKRMTHVAFHHQTGCRLEHARPDFPLYEFLWTERLIGPADYKSLKGESNGRSTTAAAAYPSPPPENEQDTALDMSTAYTVTAGRRRDRPPVARPVGGRR